jgi:hypothetical protein
MWSSAAAHCGAVTADEFLDTEVWRRHWTIGLLVPGSTILARGRRKHSWRDASVRAHRATAAVVALAAVTARHRVLSPIAKEKGTR